MYQHIKVIFTKNERMQLIFLLFGILGLGISESLGIGLLIPLIDIFMNPDKIHEIELLEKLYHFSGAEADTDFIFRLSTFIISFFVFKLIYSLSITYISSRLTSNFEIRLSNQILSAYLKKGYQFHLENNSAVLFKNVTTEVNTVCQSFINVLLKLLSETVIILCILFFLLVMYPEVTLTSLLVLGILGGIIYKTIQSGMKEISALRSMYYAEYFKTGMEALDGIKDVKVFNSRDFFRTRYKDSFTKASRITIQFTMAQGAPRFLIEAILFIAFISVMVGSMYFGYASEDLISTMAVMAAASVKIFPSIVNISQGITNVRFHSKNVEIIANIILEAQGVEDESDEKHPIKTIHSPIRIHNLSFRYNQEHPNVLKNLSLEITPNCATAFVGESGSGKSTLIDILTGLLNPQVGEIYYGEEKITPETLYHYRSKIGYVPQQIFLYDDTLLANVAFGIPEDEIDIQRVKEVLHTAQLTELVTGLPDGLHTTIGEKGVKLSGGQRQRIGIARALYRNPEILIFDEATAALDNRTEIEVNQAIKNLQRKVTVILVAHRLQTIQQADFIYLLDKGSVGAYGTYEELAEKSTQFQKIILQQSS